MKAFLKKEVKRIGNLNTISKKRIKALQQAQRRIKQKVAKLQNIISDLTSKKILLEEHAGCLENIAGANKDLLMRQVAKKEGASLPHQYSPELRTFALTLHFYSPRAYDYVRQTFDACLPHPRTIKKWYQSIDGEAGFSREALSALEMKAATNTRTGLQTVCSLMVDEMAIRRHIEWDGRRTYGYATAGPNCEDSSIVAKEAFVMLLVALNEQWKLPIGYFLVDGLTGEQRSNLVLEGLSLSHNAGITVVSLTCDGAAANLSMLQNLGCSLQPDSLRTSFPHPNTAEPINVFLDACHMLKLVRNALCHFKLFVDEDGCEISWNHIEALHSIQQEEGLHAANRLRTAHVHFQRQVMKVSLAAELLSTSVADAISECRNLGVPGCEKSEGTERFLRVINNVFDVLNSRNVHQKGWKKPLCPENIESARIMFLIATSYIRALRKSEHGKPGPPLLQTNRKTGFLGFLVCCNSTIQLYDFLVSKSLIQYLPTHRVSQDHLELFFGLIRSHGGYNNNPTARQFAAAYKRLIVNTEVEASQKGNCLPLENVSILHVSSATQPRSEDVINWTSRGRSNTTEQTPQDDLPDHDYFTDPTEPTTFGDRIVVFIAGHIACRLREYLTCETCISQLTVPVPSVHHSLMQRKDKYGDFLYPSDDVITICRKSEKLLRRALLQEGISSKTFLQKVLLQVMESLLDGSVFSPLRNEHMLEQTCLESHLFHLIRAVAQRYLSVRIRHAANTRTEELHKLRCRQLFTKLTQFKGQ